jgi:hypothetical protein
MDKKIKVVEFEKEKDTTHTVKYKEVTVEGQAHMIGTLYVQKWVAGNADKVKVILEFQ